MLLGLSFYARRFIGARRWRSLHRATIVVWVLGVVHTLGAGTDAGQAWLQGILVLTGIPIVYLFLLRVLPERGARTSPPPRRSPVEQFVATEGRALAGRLRTPGDRVSGRAAAPSGRAER